MKKEKGITLIALVITIIVLIILAGISINLVLGENGILKRANKGKEEYKEASIKEKIEIALMDYNSEKITNSENIEIEDALNILLEKRIFNKIQPQSNKGIIDNYQVTLEKQNNEIVIKTIQLLVTNSNYIYNNGDQCLDITGGWRISGSVFGGGNLDLTKNSLNYSAGYEKRVYVSTIQPIDFTEYTKIIISYKGFFQCIFSENANVSTANPDFDPTWISTGIYAEEIQTQIIETKNFGIGYLQLTVTNGSTEVQSIILE